MRVEAGHAVAADVGGAVRIDGRRVSRELLEECRAASEMLAAAFDVVPQLAVVLVGEDPASEIYVRSKARACERAAVRSRIVSLPAGSDTAEVWRAVDALAEDPHVHGIIVQLPLPKPPSSAGSRAQRTLTGSTCTTSARSSPGSPCFPHARPRV